MKPQEFTEAQTQLSAALRNFWPVTYPEISSHGYGPDMIQMMNKYLADWHCQFVYPDDNWLVGDFQFESDEYRVQFLLTWGGSQ